MQSSPSKIHYVFYLCLSPICLKPSIWKSCTGCSFHTHSIPEKTWVTRALYQLNSISNLKPWKRKKRKEFHTWYATQVEKNELYDLWDELNKYCHSDVMVLKAACFKFVHEFKEEAGFNPMEKCATIASACSLFWRQEFIPEDTIAVESLNGWRGNQVNQSKVALEWLCYEDFKLGGNRLHDVRNGGEKKVLTPAEAMFVDGYDEESKTVYQFQGCFYHGCIKGFPNNRHRKHNCHPDGIISEIYEATRRKMGAPV